ncbi:MAG: metalloregulator ArsR/SmtB family transcription factor [Chloroflexi bacterium]|nr:metalloregulator ArsR/SmtB family transcription factor [Chloroflexota bacterium]
MEGREQPAVALCRLCSIGLCKAHLVEVYEPPSRSAAVLLPPHAVGAARSGVGVVDAEQAGGRARRPARTGGRRLLIAATRASAKSRSAAPRDLAPQAAQLLSLVADPTRRRIYLRLIAGETCNCELAGELGLTQNLVSYHVRLLGEAGLVRERRDPEDARWIHYRICTPALYDVWRALEQAFAPARLRHRASECSGDP